MKIITDIHDYYDGVIRTSVSDKSFTFVRKTQEFESDIFTISYKCQNKNDWYLIQGGVLGFCGMIYPYISVNHDYYYDYDSLNTKWSTIIHTPPYCGYCLFHYKDNNITNEFTRWFNGEYLRGWMQETVNIKKAASPIFEKKRVAYFVTVPFDKESHIIVYPNLKEYQFYKVFDPYTTFQKIEMFLTNELVRPDEINIVIDNKDKIQSHGFDKYSFRKEKDI